MFHPRSKLLLPALVTLLGCSSSSTPVPSSVGSAATPSPAAPTPAAAPAAISTPAPPLVGVFRRESIEEALPAWGAAVGAAHPDATASAALIEVPPGPKVVVLFGSWCGDSRRELARLWSAFDLAGGAPRFEIQYVAVDRAKQEPAALVAGRDLRFVPTFIVERDGKEVGRIVESSPRGIEADLLDLVTGSRQGLITARTDLAP